MIQSSGPTPGFFPQCVRSEGFFLREMEFSCRFSPFVPTFGCTHYPFRKSFHGFTPNATYGCPFPAPVLKRCLHAPVSQRTASIYSIVVCTLKRNGRYGFGEWWKGKGKPPLARWLIEILERVGFQPSMILPSSSFESESPFTIPSIVSGRDPP